MQERKHAMRHNRYYNNRRRRQQKKRFWQLIQALFLVLFIATIIIISIRTTQSLRRKNEETNAVEQLDRITNVPMPTQSDTVHETNPPKMFEEAKKLLQQNLAIFCLMVGTITLVARLCLPLAMPIIVSGIRSACENSN